MRTSLGCLMLGMLIGCGRPAVPVFTADKLADGKAAELVRDMWGKVGYAPKQYAGFAYDSTGVYGNLHGLNPPEMVAVAFHASRDGKGIADREICFSSLELVHTGRAADEPGIPPVPPTHGLTDDHFKWLGRPRGLIAATAISYGRTFWISWKALGLDAPPADGQLRIFVRALVRKGTGVSFLVDANRPQ